MNNITTIPVPNSMIRNNTLTSSELLIYIYLVENLVCNTKTNKFFKINKSKISQTLSINNREIISLSLQNLDKADLINLSNNTINYADKDNNKFTLDIDTFKVPANRDGMNEFTQVPKEVVYSKSIMTNDKVALIKLISLNGFKKKPTSISAIASILNMNRASISKIIKRLCEKGYYTYESDITNFKLHFDPVVKTLKTIRPSQPKISEEECSKLEQSLATTTKSAEEELNQMTKPKEKSLIQQQIEKELAEARANPQKIIINKPKEKDEPTEEELDALLAFI